MATTGIPTVIHQLSCLSVLAILEVLTAVLLKSQMFRQAAANIPKKHNAFIFSVREPK
jgi:hypothetical protein